MTSLLAVAPDDPADATLVDLARSGERDAYALLYERHAAIAHRVARSLLSNPFEVDDVVAEVFTTVLAALERGNGPVGTFLPYLLSSIRNECYRINRRNGREPADGTIETKLLDGDRRAPDRDPSSAFDEAEVVRQAFDSLPANFREVLWLTEVEDASPGDVATVCGGTSNAVATTLLRARRALARAYLQQHLGAVPQNGAADTACTAARPLLTDYVRGVVGIRQRRHIEQHLERCSACNEECRRLGGLNRHLRTVPFWPAILGTPTPTAVGLKAQLVAWFTSAATPLAASGALAITAFAPAITYDDVVPERTSAPAVVEVEHVGTGSTAPIAVAEEVTPSAAAAVASPHHAAESESSVEPNPAPPADAGLPSSMPPPSRSTDAPALSGAPTVSGSPANEVLRPTATSADASAVVGSDPPAQPASSGQSPQAKTETTSDGASNSGQPDGEDSPDAIARAPRADDGASPPGQLAQHADHRLGAPPGQQDGHGSDDGASPPGQLAQHADHPLGAPPGQQDGHSSDRGASPPGLQDNPGNGHARSTPGHQDGEGDGLGEPAGTGGTEDVPPPD